MTVRSVDNSQNRVNKPLVATTAVAGAITGGYLARTSLLPAAKKVELSKLVDYPQNMVKKIMDSIDLEKAQQAFDNKKINEASFNLIKKTKEQFSKIYEKQMNLSNLKENIAETTAEAYKKAEKETIKVFHSFKEVFFNMQHKFTKDFVDLDIVNGEQYKNAMDYILENSKKMIKIVAKPLAIGIIAGTAAGTLIGLGLNSLFKSSNSKN